MSEEMFADVVDQGPVSDAEPGAAVSEDEAPDPGSPTLHPRIYQKKDPAALPALSMDRIDRKDSCFQDDLSPTMYGVRTAEDAPADPDRALLALRHGNKRFVIGETLHQTTADFSRAALASHGQRPMATIIGCADSRCPVEIIFDSQPGDLFVLRNAGNTCIDAECSLVGSTEYSVQHLSTQLVLVMGHTKCGAIAGATRFMLDHKNSAAEDVPCTSMLGRVLKDLAPIAAKAAAELPEDASFDDLALHACRVNVFNTVDTLIEFSQEIQDKLRAKKIKVEGSIYNIETGRVSFIGPSPNQATLIGGDLREEDEPVSE